MKSYSLEIERAALKDMKSFPRPFRELTLEQFDLLVENPFRGQPLAGVLSHLRSYHFDTKALNTVLPTPSSQSRNSSW